MNEKYAKPPLIEAICELHFHPNPKWDYTFPGLFYEKIRSKFPEKREIKALNLNFKLENNPSPINLKENIGKIQFWTKDKNKVLQLGENFLIINQRAPYNTWDSFKSLILENLSKYINATEQNEIMRVEMQYINKFSNLPDEFDFEEYFNFYPKTPDDFYHASGPIQMNMNFPIKINDEHQGFLNLNLLTREWKRKLEFLFIIRFNSIEQKITIAEVSDILEIAHQEIKNAFMKSLTQKMKHKFGQMENV